MQENRNKVMVLFSGGLDSTVLLHEWVARVGAENVIALSIYYGQRHEKELQYSRWQCNKLGVKHIESDLSAVFHFNPDSSALLKDSTKELEFASYAEQLKKPETVTVSAYVPYRNGLFLSYAAAVALQLGCDTISYGAHSDDAAGAAYPDCTEEFIVNQGAAISAGTAHQVGLHTPYWDKTKAEVVARGIACGMSEDDFAHTWSCYVGGDDPCGQCGTCIDRQCALRANGITNVK